MSSTTNPTMMKKKSKVVCILIFLFSCFIIIHESTSQRSSIVQQEQQNDRLDESCPVESKKNIRLLMKKRFDVLVKNQYALLNLFMNKPKIWPEEIALFKHLVLKKEKEEGGNTIIIDTSSTETDHKIDDKYISALRSTFIDYYGSKLCHGLFGVK
jgi:uncharacterized protein YifN (PemK superfamily)